jgi:hypothetical protein
LRLAESEYGPEYRYLNWHVPLIEKGVNGNCRQVNERAAGQRKIAFPEKSTKVHMLMNAE